MEFGVNVLLDDSEPIEFGARHFRIQQPGGGYALTVNFTVPLAARDLGERLIALSERWEARQAEAVRHLTDGHEPGTR